MNKLAAILCITSAVFFCVVYAQKQCTADVAAGPDQVSPCANATAFTTNPITGVDFCCPGTNNPSGRTVGYNQYKSFTCVCESRSGSADSPRAKYCKQHPNSLICRRRG
ncbi:hypothetical protein ElyMa_001157200 [Elysia marginata]|uniref:Secreted protein n=1 Tax=Elysia marginata TaxID=1093978 RepID=A0AAV4I1C0_9GAST|nr:hypothetical protein ElyMa_001157200 [Elysia marginata]